MQIQVGCGVGLKIDLFIFADINLESVLNAVSLERVCACKCDLIRLVVQCVGYM